MSRARPMTPLRRMEIYMRDRADITPPQRRRFGKKVRHLTRAYVTAKTSVEPSEGDGPTEAPKGA